MCYFLSKETLVEEVKDEEERREISVDRSSEG